MYSPLWNITHQSPSVLCTPPFEKSLIKSHRFCVLPPLKNHPSKSPGFMYSPLWIITHHTPSVLCTPPPLKNHPSKAIGFVYSPLWKITHQSPSVLCTPPFEKSPIKAHRFCVLSPLKNHYFWWAFISGWAFILTNTKFCLQDLSWQGDVRVILGPDGDRKQSGQGRIGGLLRKVLPRRQSPVEASQFHGHFQACNHDKRGRAGKGVHRCGFFAGAGALHQLERHSAGTVFRSLLHDE